MLVANKIDQYGDRMVFVEDGQRRYREIGCVGFREISVRESIEQVGQHASQFSFKYLICVCVCLCCVSLWTVGTFYMCANYSHYLSFIWYPNSQHTHTHTVNYHCTMDSICSPFSCCHFHDMVYLDILFFLYQFHYRFGVYSMIFVKCGKYFHVARDWSVRPVKFNRVLKVWLVHRIRQFVRFSIIRCVLKNDVHFSLAIGRSVAQMNLLKGKNRTDFEHVHQLMEHYLLVHVRIIHFV